MHRQHAALAVLAAALVAVGGCATRPSENPGIGRATPESLARFGAGFMDEMKGRTDEAQAAYLQAIERDPDYEPLYVRVATLRVARNDFAGAMEILRRLEQRHPRSPDVQRAMARVSLSERKPAAAIGFLQRAVDLAPTNSEYAAELCTVLARENREHDAMAVARASMARSPPCHAMQRLAGSIYLRTRAAGADPALRKAADALFETLDARTKGDADARVAIGNVRLAAGQSAPALKAYREAVDARPGDARLYARVARILMAEDREDDVIRIVEEGVEKADERVGLRRVLGGLLERRAGRTNDPAVARADRERALDLLRQVDRDMAAGPDIAASIGRLQVRLGRDLEAMEAFARVPQDAPAIRRILAMEFLADGDTNGAVRRVKALAAAPVVGRLAAFYLGELHLAAGDEKGARAAFEQCAAGDPPEAAPFIRLAGMSDTDAKAAMSWIVKGLARMPDQPALLQVRAVIEMLGRDFAAAETTYAKLEKLTDPDDLRSLLGLRVAQAVAMQADRREGQAADRLAAVLDPDYLALEVYVRLAFDVGRRIRDHDASRRVLKRVGELRPKDPAVRMYLGLYELTADNYPPAIAAFEDALRVANENPATLELIRAPFYFWYGSALERNKQYDRAEEMIERCIAMDRSYTEAFNYLAYTWAELGAKLDRATEYIRIALDREPGNGAYLDTLGWILFKQGRAAEALVELEKAVKAIPEEDATVLDHVGDALAKLGREADALPKWKRAFVLDPKSETVRRKLVEHGVDLAPLEREAAEIQQRKDRDLESLAGLGGDGAGEGDAGDGAPDEDGDEDPMLP